MKIPKTLRIGRKLYKASVVRNMKRQFFKGQVAFHERLIQVARNSSDMRRRYGEGEKQETFWHEVTHAILEDMNHKLYNNEQFVTRFSMRLNGAIRSAKF